MKAMGQELALPLAEGLDLSRLRERLATSTGPAEAPPVEGHSRAAVATVLRPGTQGPEVLLIRRAEHPRDPWSGHMAFPGGREDPRDGTLYRTAVRETLEELALDLERHGRLLGRLAPIPAMARGRAVGMTIAPFVFELVQPAPFTMKTDEVSEALWAPIVPMMRGELASTMQYELGGQRYTLPAHAIEGRVVWGLTYRMLENLFALWR